MDSMYEVFWEFNSKSKIRKNRKKGEKFLEIWGNLNIFEGREKKPKQNKTRGGKDGNCIRKNWNYKDKHILISKVQLELFLHKKDCEKDTYIGRLKLPSKLKGRHFIYIGNWLEDFEASNSNHEKESNQRKNVMSQLVIGYEKSEMSQTFDFLHLKW